MQDLYLFLGKAVFWVVIVPTMILYVFVLLLLISEQVIKKLNLLRFVAIFYKHKDEFFEWKKNKKDL